MEDQFRPPSHHSIDAEDSTVEDSMVPLGPPVPRSIPGTTAIPRAITPQMITDAFSTFIAKCANAFPAPDLIGVLGGELAAVEQQNLPTREHLRACEATLVHLRKFIPGLFAGAESERVGEIYKDTFRLHTLGMCLCHSLLHDLVSGLELMPVESILVPCCGQLFEGPVLDAVFAPRSIIGQDTNAHALSLALQHNANTLSVVLQNVDSARLPANHAQGIDMAICLHPNILDTAFWQATVDVMSYELEDFAPVEAVRAELCGNAIAQQWKGIVNTMVARLRQGGHLVFVFYELRELELMAAYLGSLGGTVAVERICSAPGLTTWLFNEPPAIQDPRFQSETYEFLVMRNYGCGLVARKL